MEVISWNLHHGSYLIELTSSKLPSGTYTMKFTSWNLHHGSYLMEHRPRTLTHGTYTMKLPHGTYIMDVT